jgi:hypothetical protein
VASYEDPVITDNLLLVAPHYKNIKSVYGMALAIMLASCAKTPDQTVVIDQLSCVMPPAATDSACTKWEPYGDFVIAINSPANACTVAFEYPGGKGSSKFYKTDNFSYVDADNWECRVIADPAFGAATELLLVNMTRGDLTAHYLFPNLDYKYVKFTLRSRKRQGGFADVFK